MRTLLILDIAALNEAEVAQLQDRVADSQLSIIDLSPEGAPDQLASAFVPFTPIKRSDLGKAIETTDETLVVVAHSVEAIKFIEGNKDALVSANAQVIDFNDTEKKQTDDIEALKKQLATVTNQVSSLAQELASVKMINQAILGCMPEDQRQQIEATAAHMQATMNSTMSLMRQFVEYSAKLTDKISIDKAMSEFGETLGLGESFADMVLGTLENVYSGEDFESYVNNPIDPYDLATDPSLSKAMMAAYASIVSSANNQQA